MNQRFIRLLVLGLLSFWVTVQPLTHTFANTVQEQGYPFSLYLPFVANQWVPKMVPVPTATVTRTSTATRMPTATATNSSTATVTRTPTATATATNTLVPTVTPIVANKVNFNFGPYIDGQDPNTGIYLTETQIRQRLALIAPYSHWVRSFSCGNGLEVIGRIAREMGLKVAMTAWVSTDSLQTTNQVNCLITQTNMGNVDLAIVGSEALLRRDVPLATIETELDRVQGAIPSSIPVTTADSYGVYLGNLSLADHIDVVMANIYPFWETFSVDYDVALVNRYYGQLVQAFPTKPVYISETGWPSCGSNGASIGSVSNAAAIFGQTQSWAKDNNIQLFYFQALDESWKATYEGPQGACWGVFDKNGVMKPGMSSVFDGTYTPYSLELPRTCNASTQSIAFTYVPPIGSGDNVRGTACGVFYQDYNIVLFILVNGVWWVKPTYANPYTPINADGTFTVDYTTGGTDQNATELKAYLLPDGVDYNSDLSGYPSVVVIR